MNTREKLIIPIALLLLSAFAGSVTAQSNLTSQRQARGVVNTLIDSLSHEKNPPAFDVPIDPDLYLVRPGEVLTVFFTETRIPPMILQVDAEGRIISPDFGVIYVTGLTFTQTKEKLTERLSRLYKAKEIVISIASNRELSVKVDGAVKFPGNYTGFASQTVREMIEKAGGLTERASTRNILFSGGPKPLKVDLDKALIMGGTDAVPYLYAGKVIHVPLRSDSIVQVIGEVNNPRTIELTPGDNLDELIQLAGGLNAKADLSSCYLMNDRNRDPKQPGNIKPGDIICVPSISGSEAQAIVTITGAVMQPGSYTLNTGLTLSGLVGLSGGYQSTANANRTVVFRTVKADPVSETVTGRYPLMINNSGNRDDMKLQPGDSVVVPIMLGYVRVSGDIAHPGLYPFMDNMTVDYYIKIAGGLTTESGNAEVTLYDRLTRMTRQTAKTEKVFDGDWITVKINGEEVK